MYQYQCEVIRVVDGDTVYLSIDLGMKIYHRSNCRLAGINAPELKSIDEAIRVKAIIAKEFLTQQLPVGAKVIIDSKSLDKYGRPIVVIWVGTVNINDSMITSGNAVKY